MSANCYSVKTLLAVLPLIAGGIIGCESVKPAQKEVIVPIGSGQGGATTAQRPAATTTQATRPATTTSAPSTSSGSTASSASTAPAPASSAPSPGAQSVVYYPTCQDPRNAALKVEKIAPTEATVGAQTGYQIKVTNLTQCTIDNVVVDERVPSGFNVASMTPQGGSGAGGATSFNLGSIAAGQSKTIDVKGSFSKAGSYTGCCDVSYTLPVCMTMNVTAPALQLTKTMPPESLICDNIPIKLVVTNSGTGTARNVTIKDQLPAGLSAIGSATEWNVGNLGPGQSATREFMVKADKVGSYTNTANAMAEGGLTASSGAVTVAVKAPTLAIDKKCPGQLRQGQNARFEIVVSNTGNAVAANTVVSDPIPAGATFVSATEGGTLQGNAVVWNLGAMQPGASRTLGLVLRSGTAGTINNTATATATCAQAVSDGCSVSFFGVPDIGTGIEDFTGVRNIGDNHDFDFIVKNQGQVDLTNVKVVFKADTGLDFVSTNWPGGAQNAAGSQTVNIGTLRVGEQKVFKIVYKGSKAGQLILRSETTSDQTAMVRNDEQVNYVD